MSGDRDQGVMRSSCPQGRRRRIAPYELADCDALLGARAGLPTTADNATLGWG
jgi:hypothetical protein